MSHRQIFQNSYNRAVEAIGMWDRQIFLNFNIILASVAMATAMMARHAVVCYSIPK